MRDQLSFTDVDLIIVGSGFFGATVAERTANELQKKVLVLERRPHIGGNAFTETDPETNVELHRYGAHLFHTSNQKVWDYLNRFTAFTNYQHRVYTRSAGLVYSMPINLHTICSYFGRAFTPQEARELIALQAAEMEGRVPANLEEKAISLIGRPLYEAFIKGYTLKQWQTDPRDLPENIITRLPVRYTFNNRYFDDCFEGLPVDGYTPIFDRMLSSPNIKVVTNIDYFEIRAMIPAHIPLVFTGPIDRFFDYAEGHLGWRTIDFEWEVAGVDDFQGAPVMNYADESVPFTRIIEFKHFKPDRAYTPGKTTIVREYSRSARTSDEPYYPINTAQDKAIFSKYKSKAELLPEILFGGRLGTYKYLDMHQAIAAASLAFENNIKPRLLLGRGLNDTGALKGSDAG